MTAVFTDIHLIKLQSPAKTPPKPTALCSKNSVKNGTKHGETPQPAYGVQHTTDSVINETPVALVYNGIAHTVMMCTPQDLTDFALGFSFSEGIIHSPTDIYGMDIEAMERGIEVQIELSSRRFADLKAHRRTLTGRTGCGICGAEQLNQVYKNLPKLDRTLHVSPTVFNPALARFDAAQHLTQRTGAAHAAAFFTPEGNLLAIREDVGRHVALDKLIGWYLNAKKPQGWVLVSSRASYEMVQKTVSAGIEMLVALSAATDLAVTTAQTHRLTLLGFTRPNRTNLYTEPTRLGI